MATISDVSEAAKSRRVISCVRMRQLPLEGECFCHLVGWQLGDIVWE
jgi:hypothetical protein